MTSRGPRGLTIAVSAGVALGVTVLAAAFGTLWAEKAQPEDFLPDRPGATWVSIHPIQCLGNPWEEDWLRTNNGSFGSYPSDWEAQRVIVIDYYTRLGFRVFEARRQVWDGAVCAGCSCPAGYTLFLQVADEDVARMVALGFAVVP